jgi:hypothetical protein
MPRRTPPTRLHAVRLGPRRLIRWLPAAAAAAALTSPAAAPADPTPIDGLTGGALAPPDLAPPNPPPVATIAPPHFLNATFTEGAPLTRTRHCATKPRICQAVLKGTGSLADFGAATEITGLTQDREVTPCGPRSDSEAYTRRIKTSHGVLALRASGVKCPTHPGFRVTARYHVDGDASTGEFAGARGSGFDTVKLQPGQPSRVTISGSLRLARCDCAAP